MQLSQKLSELLIGPERNVDGLRSRLNEAEFTSQRPSFTEESAAIGEERWEHEVASNMVSPLKAQELSNKSDNMNKSFVFKQKPDPNEAVYAPGDSQEQEEPAQFETRTRYFGGREDERLVQEVLERRQSTKDDLMRLQ